MLYISLCRFTI